MPTYTYACKNCEHKMDVFHSMNDAPKVKCEACGSTRTVKQLGTGAGIIFKGSGFYETDYKEKPKAPSDKSSSDSGKSEKSESKPESKPAAKTETKSESKSSSAKSESS